MVTIYNSLTGRKAQLEPIEPGRVGVYVCGITAYDYCHIGHARVLVAFDVVVRYLRFRGYAVTYVRNITDIDDKIIDRARENDEPWREVTDRFIAAMHEDAATLAVRPPDHEPRATEHLDAIVAMIQELEARGFAYVTDGGDVYYDVSRFPEYGKLSGERPEALRAGARVDVDASKSDPLDFALWKAAKPGEPAWPSPWGPGRPGWHIECSAMSTSCLGEHFDIHGGGLDLKFPHHENEIAQSEAANATAFVNTWMHVGFVEVDAEKMSKSLGNFSTIRDVLRGYQPETVRYFMLASHYRSPLNYTDRNLDTARAGLERLYTALRGLDPAARPAEESAAYEERFLAAMDDDFNTPQALAVLFDLAREVNRLRNEGEMARARGMAAALVRLGEPLGLLQDDPEAYLKGAAPEGLDPAEIEERIAERARAREQRDFETADRIRDQLTEHGIELEDTAEGTIWRRR